MFCLVTICQAANCFHVRYAPDRHLPRPASPLDCGHSSDLDLHGWSAWLVSHSRPCELTKRLHLREQRWTQYHGLQNYLSIQRSQLTPTCFAQPAHSLKMPTCCTSSLVRTPSFHCELFYLDTCTTWHAQTLRQRYAGLMYHECALLISSRQSSRLP